MSFIGPALMSILANIFCDLCTWTSKQMVLQFQNIPGIGHNLEPLERVIQEKFIPASLADYPPSELDAPSWHSQQDGRDGLKIHSSNAELCFGASSNITTPISIQVSESIATSIKGKPSSSLCEIQNGKPNSLKSKEILRNFLLFNMSAGVCQTK